MKKGFTLVELLIVVIVVAILATFAIPQYLKAVERAKEGKAKHNMSLIAQGQKMYRAENDTYTAVAAGNHDATLGSYIELADVDADSDWSYVSAAPASDQFTVTATRAAGGPNAGETIVLDQDGTWTDNFTP
ncbi:MAG: prepilin-type N-terminal cleavage/methylation domain-containing protein [Candidatus Omnitrophica bacterium]|nr:prepilin-type N-terminal cleavage/methylation domain-containing protein [Candidatus Omnitrophota bacterium]MBD3269719.1 prepilin-type N-terminal cleavage/methylation domain-containing protein [Candidatus Omnitrophota bacterium]